MPILDRQTIELMRMAVAPRTERRNATMAALAAKITCWDEVIAAARQHRIAPMLYVELKTASAVVPAEALSALRVEYERNAFHCMTNAAELLAVLKDLENAGVQAMPFKGVVLGASVYRDITERSAGDLDLLVHHRDLETAKRILRDRGYTLTTAVREDGTPEPDHYYEYHFDRSSDGMVLELRWRLELTQPRFRQMLGLDWVWPLRQSVMLAGEEVPCIDPVSNLLVLCMHGSKHGWSRLMWISDVARVLEHQPGLDWAFATREAKRLGLWRAVGLGVLLAHRVTGTQVPDEVLRGFEKARSVRRLAEFLEAHMIQHPGAKPESRVPYSIQILDFRDRAAAVLSVSFLRPTPQDRAAVKLPKGLEALYYVVRPFRLLLDRTARR